MTWRQIPMVLACSLPSFGPARANEAESMLSRVEQNYRKLSSYEFEGRSTYETTQGKSISRTEFHFRSAYSAPNKLRSEIRYPNSGIWLRVTDGEWLLEARPVGKLVRREPVGPEARRAFDGSAVYQFERLPVFAESPQVIRTETIEVAGQKATCALVQFTPKRSQFSVGVFAGTAFVWIDTARWIVLKQEIRTSHNLRGVVHHSRKTVAIENFRLNEALSESLFSTKVQD